MLVNMEGVCSVSSVLLHSINARECCLERWLAEDHLSLSLSLSLSRLPEARGR